jgi:hypothetical protein
MGKPATTLMLRRTRIRRVSAKKRELDKQYYALRKQFLALHPLCEVSKQLGEQPPRQATDIHHTQGRGKNYLAVETWMAVSRFWHNEIHHNPKWAREQGYLK